MSEEDVFLIVGLGNPGKRYVNTRHNAGFMLIDKIADRFGGGQLGERDGALYCRTRIGGAEVVLAKPQTFMNNSGHAVRAFKESLGLGPENIIIACDDVELPSGKLRVRARGGSGGQNGLASVIDCLGTKDFTRVRLGIGSPSSDGDDADNDEDLSDYVLSNFNKDEVDAIDEMLTLGVSAIETIIIKGVTDAMNDFN